MELSGATLHKGIRLDECRFTQGVYLRATSTRESFSARESAFEAIADFTDGLIEVNLDIGNARFNDQADFRRITVGKETRRADTTFSGVVLFANGRFQSTATFDGATFNGVANFDEAQFLETLYLKSNHKKVVFSEETFFTDLKVAGVCIISGATFRKNVNFTRASIKGGLYVNGCQFQSRAIFQLLDTSILDFSEDDHQKPTEFFGDADFFRARIHQDAFFVAVQFHEVAQFRFISIGGDAWFNSAPNGLPVRFRKDADFNQARISGSAWFRGAKFIGKADFTEGRIGNAAYFSPV